MLSLKIFRVELVVDLHIIITTVLLIHMLKNSLTAFILPEAALRPPHL
jgi:hypothetical protein